MEREAFLEQIRLKGPAPENLPHPLREVSEIPLVQYVRDLSDPVSAFIDVANEIGANARLISSADEMTEMLDQLIDAHDVKTAVLSKDPEVEVIRRRVANGSTSLQAVEFESFGAASSVDLGVTGAEFGVAATGSLVMHPARAGGRSSSLLPPVHLALIDEKNILRDSSEVFRKMGERFPDRLPSQLVFASGPSRSGDIGGVLTVGVHGPGHVWIGVLKD